MAVATFDTLKFSKALREAGVPEKQADAEATLLSDLFSLNFKEIVTKDDQKRAAEDFDVKLRELEQRLNIKLDQLRCDLRETEQRLSAKMDQNKLEAKADFNLLKWMMGFVLTILIGVAIRLFIFPK